MKSLQAALQQGALFAILLTAANAFAMIPVPASSQLAAVQKAGSTGFQTLDVPSQLDLLQKARDFADYRRSLRPSETSLAQSCLHDVNSSFFCRYVKSPSTPPPPSPLLEEVITGPPPPLAPLEGTQAEQPHPKLDPLTPIRDSLREGNLTALKLVPESTLHRALREFESYDSLTLVTRSALREKGCGSAVLLTSLGMKTEEYFPAPKFRRLAVELYSKAATCKTSSIVVKAEYRLSLLEIWAGHWGTALRYLSRLTDQDNDYQSRALFWKGYCAKKLRLSRLVSQATSKLVHDFPLSYHAALARPSVTKVAFKRSRANLGGGAVTFRSANKIELNEITEAAEALFQINEPKFAGEVLSNGLAEIDEAEPAFQLYYGLLLNRAGDHRNKFRLLAALFKDQPATMTREALELYYPRGDIALLVPRSVKVDPLWILSVIRQESAFNDRATSPVGAMGLMQIMPTTARVVERDSVSSLYDPATNIRVGTRYLGSLLKKYEGNIGLSLAAYNAGPQKVDLWKRRYPVSNPQLFLDLIPFKETRDYVATIERNYLWYKSLYK